MCVCGDKQEHGVDFFKTYAPAVQWTTIQLILIVANVLNWVTVHMDYTNAFAQAPLDEELFMELPKDFMTTDVDNNYILCLNKSFYGLKQAPLSWFAHLKQHLESHGFIASSIDQCLFINKTIMIFALSKSGSTKC